MPLALQLERTRSFLCGFVKRQYRFARKRSLTNSFSWCIDQMTSAGLALSPPSIWPRNRCRSQESLQNNASGPQC